MSDVFPVILAGGKGERFWPWSTSKRPKQVLPLIDDEPMLIKAVKMAQSVSGGNPIHVIISANLHERFSKELAPYSDVRLVTEPEGRDTAAAVALGAKLIAQINPQGVMAALTADHLIRPVEEFVKTFEAAFTQARLGESLVTLGIIPSRADTGFGYLELGAQATPLTSFEVLRFVEKPNSTKAQEYLESGRFLWNSGMFIWRVDYFWQVLQDTQPELANLLHENAESLGEGGNPLEALRSFYGQLPKISVDFGVMEKAPKIDCIPVSFEWEDLGSWNSLEKVHGKDDQGNVQIGQNTLVDCSNTIAVNLMGEPVVAFGLKNCLVTRVDGLTVVVNREKVPNLKELVKYLRENGFESLL